MKSKAVFLDRDGTLIEDVEYLSKAEDIRIIPGAIEAIKKLNGNNFKVIMVTNQSGIARGILSEEKFIKINKILIKRFAAQGAFFADAYYCPHHPTKGDFPYRKECNCRKPAPGLILKAGGEHKIDLNKSFMVGDKKRDIEAGINAGCRTILISKDNKKSIKSRTIFKTDYIACNIVKAAKWIINVSRSINNLN